jgi:hypothetical protein
MYVVSGFWVSGACHCRPLPRQLNPVILSSPRSRRRAAAPRHSFHVVSESDFYQFSALRSLIFGSLQASGLSSPWECRELHKHHNIKLSKSQTLVYRYQRYLILHYITKASFRYPQVQMVKVAFTHHDERGRDPRVMHDTLVVKISTVRSGL